MAGPLIAVIGDAAKSNNPERARQAARDLGGELAKRGCRILVFSNNQEFVEWEAVQGYLKSTVKKEPRSIEVRYPPEFEGRFPDEQPDHDPLFVRRQQGGDWEGSFYPSFAEMDGLVLIGGGYTTKIAGLLALGSKTPLLTLGGLGGAAHEVWAQLRGDRNSTATDDDLDLMATTTWGQNSAERFVNALLGQRQRKLDLERQAALGESERHRRHVLTSLAVLGSALFVLVLFALVESGASTQVSRWSLWLLFGAPAVAGASGAAIRVLWDNWERHGVPLELRPVAMTVALGLWASGVAGALFLLPQIWVGGVDAAKIVKLSGFAVPIGLLAGLTLDKVFPRLIKSEVPLNTGQLAKDSHRGRAARVREPGDT